MVKLSRKDKPWVTPKLKVMFNDKWDAWRNKNIDKFIHLKTKIKDEIAKCKNNWAEKVKNKSKNIWQSINCFSGKQTNTGLSSLLANYNNNTLELIDAVSIQLNNSFGPPSSYDVSSTLTDDNHNDDIHEVTETEVYGIIASTKTNKAAGPDKIPTILYKSVADIICSPLTIIINACIINCTVPRIWKQALVVPIAKTNPPKINELRPISLLSLPSKVFERVILNQLKTLFIQNYDKAQFGFRPGSSTTCALLALQSHIVNLLDNPLTTNVILIQLDLSKAFDLVCHNLLLKKLSLFLPQKALALMKAYLSHRQQKVQINGVAGTYSLIPSGVPQGSLLGPYLFGVYFADFKAKLGRSELVKFADDATLIIPLLKSDSPTSIQNMIVDEIMSAMEWCSNNMQVLNADKIKMLNITFNPLGWKPSNCFVYYRAFVEDVRILGVIFNKKLSWSSHFAYITRIVNSRLYALRILRDFLSPAELRSLYCATIRNIMEYASPLFLNLPAVHQKKLTKIQKRAHKIVCGVHRCDCLEDLANRRNTAARRLFNKVKCPTNILHSFLPNYISPYSGRIITPFSHTSRKLNSFFIYIVP